MQLLNQNGPRELRLITEDEVDIVLHAAQVRTHSIPWFDVFHRRRRDELQHLRTELGAKIDSAPVVLTADQSDLALEAMHWAVDTEEAQDLITSDIRALLDSATSAA